MMMFRNSYLISVILVVVLSTLSVVVSDDVADVTDVTDVPGVADVTDVPGVADVTDVPDVTDVTDVPDVADVTDVPDVADVTDVPDVAEVIGVRNAADDADVNESGIVTCEIPSIENGQILGEIQTVYNELETLTYQCNFNYTLYGKYGILICNENGTWSPSFPCSVCWRFTYHFARAHRYSDVRFNGTDQSDCNATCSQEPDCTSATFYEGYCFRSFFLRSLNGVGYKECEKVCYNDDQCNEMVWDGINCQLLTKKFNDYFFYFSSLCI